MFETAYREILTRAVTCCRPKLLLIDPFYMSTDTAPASFRTKVLSILPEYLRVVHRMAREFGATSVRTHERFARQLRYRPSDIFCGEPVHPNLSGHMIIAHGVLDALDW